MTPDPSGSDDDASDPPEPDGTEDEAADLPDKLFFRIGEAAQLVGVETHVLRYWESEFQMRPQRSTSGQRMYRRKDIARFLRIRRLLHDEGFTIAGARKALFGVGAEPAQGTMDAGRIFQALERIATARQRIAAVRVRLEQIGLNAPE
jgi:DNA-binding transcriptional MerR regulator